MEPKPLVDDDESGDPSDATTLFLHGNAVAAVDFVHRTKSFDSDAIKPLRHPSADRFVVAKCWLASGPSQPRQL